MLYILFGEDDFSLRQSLEEIKRGIGDQAALVANITTLDGRRLTLDQLRAVCETAPFLAERRLVIVEGLLECFESRGKSSPRKKAKRVTSQQDEYQSLITYISEPPDSTVLVLAEGRITSKNPQFKELSNKAEVRSFPLLKGARLRQWIQKRVAEEGGSISPQAEDLLARLIGGDLWIMANEISKLALFAPSRCIEEEDVRKLVSYAQQADVFTMIDAILELKAGVAEQSLQQLLLRGAAPAYLLAMLSRQLRMMIRGKELKNQGRPEGEIQSRLGLASEFALRKTLEQAGRYPWERLKEVYRKLLETDLSIKTGKYDGELALNILIAELCQGKVAGQINWGDIG